MCIRLAGFLRNALLVSCTLFPLPSLSGDALFAAFERSNVDALLLDNMWKAAQQGSFYRILPSASKMSLSLETPFGVAEAAFRNFQGGLALNQGYKAGSQVLIKVDAASLGANASILEPLLRSKQFFDVERYPEILFTSTAFIWSRSNGGILHGDLTVHGITRPVTFAVHVAGLEGRAGRNREKVLIWATTTVKRSDFGMGAFTGLVGDDVGLSISINAERYWVGNGGRPT